MIKGFDWGDVSALGVLIKLDWLFPFEGFRVLALTPILVATEHKW